MWRRNRDDDFYGRERDYNTGYGGRDEQDFRYREEERARAMRPYGQRMPDRADAGGELYRRLHDDRERFAAPFGMPDRDREREWDRYRGNRPEGDRYRADRYTADRYGVERYTGDRYGADRYSADRDRDVEAVRRRDFGYDRTPSRDDYGYRSRNLDFDFRPGQSFDTNPRDEYERDYYGRDYDSQGRRRVAPRNEGEYAYDPDWDRGGRWRR
jgi:hypothetical protein